MSTWRVLRWDDPPADQSSIPLRCPHCAHTADVPSGKVSGGSLVAISADGWLTFDPPCYRPPANFLPSAVQCPNCQAKLDGLGLEADDPDDLITITLLHVDERGNPQ